VNMVFSCLFCLFWFALSPCTIRRSWRPSLP
jgi:hypothetical protein